MQRASTIYIIYFIQSSPSCFRLIRRADPKLANFISKRRSHAVRGARIKFQAKKTPV